MRNSAGIKCGFSKNSRNKEPASSNINGSSGKSVESVAVTSNSVESGIANNKAKNKNRIFKPMANAAITANGAISKRLLLNTTPAQKLTTAAMEGNQKV